MTNSNKLSSIRRVLELPTSTKNFGLSESEFDSFVDRVKDGDESLFIKVFNMQFKASVVYIQNKFNIPEDVAYDTCMDTLIEFRNKLIEGKISYGNIRFLFTKMAIHNYIDYLKKLDKINCAIAIFMEDKSKYAVNRSEFFAILNEAVEQLSPSQQHTIKETFYSGKEISEIVSENKITYATYRKRKERAIKKLKHTFLTILKKNQKL